MVTTVKARGRMTKDLMTPYRVGDRVRALVWDKQRGGSVHAGEPSGDSLITRLLSSSPDARFTRAPFSECISCGIDPDRLGSALWKDFGRVK